MNTVHRLEAVPSLGGLYAGAAWGALRRVRSVAPDSLPALTAEAVGVPVDADALIAYQRLLGDTVRDEVPSVFLHGLAFPVALWLMARRDFPLPLLGMVHLSNHVRHLRPVRPQERLTIRTHVERLRPHHAGAQVDVIARILVGEELVWEGRSVYLAKGVRIEGAGVPEAVSHPAFVPPATTGRWRLDGAAGRRFAEVLGDFNPIHLSALSAKALGLKRPIAHGMYLAAKALAAVAPHGTGYAWDIEFAAPVQLPGTVEFGRRTVGDATVFAGWDARKNRPHFFGEVGAL